MNLNKDLSSWAQVSAKTVITMSSPQAAENVLTMALEDIQRLGRIVEGEREARHKLDAALRGKDAMFNKVVERARAAGVDFSDLQS